MEFFSLPVRDGRVELTEHMRTLYHKSLGHIAEDEESPNQQLLDLGMWNFIENDETATADDYDSLSSHLFDARKPIQIRSNLLVSSVTQHVMVTTLKDPSLSYIPQEELHAIFTVLESYGGRELMELVASAAIHFSAHPCAEEKKSKRALVLAESAIEWLEQN